MNSVDEIKYGGDVLAIVIPASFSSEGTRFFTPKEFSQQLGFIKHSGGDRIQPHTHNPGERIITFTQEVLFVRKGKVRVRLFSKKREFVRDKVLSAGDIILLVSGGHGFEFLEDTEVIEVKQGPYLEKDDKERFEG
jgi:mannose-6-phosphate isomerase-like protein (cupin superfamily)